MKHLLSALFLASLLLTGCASTPTQDIKIQAEAHPQANLGGYKSYAWLGAAAVVNDSAGKWEPPQFDADAEIKFLIDRELRNRGIVESSANPDALVGFAAGIDMDSLRVNVDPDGNIESLKNVPRGALVVVLLDATTEKAVWAGMATAEIRENPTTETVKARLDYAVTSMFKKLPR